jgi:hypothetical protein
MLAADDADEQHDGPMTPRAEGIGSAAHGLLESLRVHWLGGHRHERGHRAAPI